MMISQLVASEHARLNDSNDYYKYHTYNKDNAQSKMTTDQDESTLSCDNSSDDNVITLSEEQVPVDQLGETLQQLLTRYANQSDVFVKISKPTMTVITVGPGDDELQNFFHAYQSENQACAELASQSKDEAFRDAELTNQSQDKPMITSDFALESEIDANSDEEWANDMDYEVSVKSATASSSENENFTTIRSKRKRKRSLKQKYQCVKCDKVLSSKQYLLRHVRNLHTVIESSDSTFDDESTNACLLRPSCAARSGKHTCVECGKVFSAQHFLVAHLTIEHSDEISTLWINRSEHSASDWTNSMKENERWPVPSVQCHQQLQSKPYAQLQIASHPITPETYTFALPQISEPTLTDEARQKTNRSNHQLDEADGTLSECGSVRELAGIIDSVLDMEEEEKTKNMVNEVGIVASQSNENSCLPAISQATQPMVKGIDVVDNQNTANNYHKVQVVISKETLSFVNEVDVVARHSNANSNIVLNPKPEVTRVSTANFRQNTNLHHGEGRHQCSHCSKKFIYKSKLTRHVRSHTGERPFQCSDCSKSFARKEQLTAHKRTHTGERPFQCAVCSKTFAKKENLKFHTRLHAIDRYRCANCFEICATKAQLKRHMETHTNEGSSLISKIDTNNFQLDKPRILQTATIPSVNADCEVANQLESNSNNNSEKWTILNQNNLDGCHSTQQSTILLANKNCLDQPTTLPMNSVVNLNQKITIVSTGNPQRHTSLHTGERPFQCSDCGKTFAQRKHLTIHKRTHTHQRPYQCSQCPVKCNTDSQLLVHMRMHTGERSFPCSDCSKSFAQKRQLTIHKRTHTGERRFPMF